MGSVVGKYMGNISPGLLKNLGNRKRKHSQDNDSDVEGNGEVESAVYPPKR